MSKEIPQEEIPFSKEDTNISINPPKKEITPPPTYTPLSQNAKPFLSKRLKNISSQKSNEQLNKNEMKRINAGERTVVNQMNLEKNLSDFYKRMNLLKNQSIYKKSPEERYKIYKNLKREEAERKKKELEEKLEKLKI